MADRSEDEEPRPEPGHRPWVHPSELPAHLVGPQRLGPQRLDPHGLDARDDDDSGRRFSLPLTAGVAGTLAVLGIGALAFGSLGSSGSGGTQTTPGARFSATPTALGDGAEGESGGPFEGVVVHVKAWTGPQARYASAIVVDGAGTMVTSAAAVVGAGALEVDAGDGDVYAAELVGVDHAHGLAVLRSADAPLHPLTTDGRALGSLDVGDRCAVVSAERDGAPRTNFGSIAAVGAMVHHSGGWMVDAIRVDVPMTERSAGGAVLDAAGDLIGVVTLLADAARELRPVVVPAGQALDSVDEIVAHGEARHAWLGVRAVDGGGDVTVDAVVPEGPAADAGIRAGDVIAAVAGSDVNSVTDLMRAVRRHDADETVVVAVLRDGDRVELPVRLSSHA